LLGLEGISLNGDPQQRIAHTLNLCIDRPGFNVASLASDLAVSSTSACNSASSSVSHVLLALGLTPAQAGSSLRLSLGRYTTECDVEKAMAVIAEKARAQATTFW
jgi:cysteine desulfurase